MKTEIRWAVILAIVTLLWFVLEKISGFDGEFIQFHETAGWFYLIPFAMVYVMALLQKRNGDLGGSMSFMDGLKSVGLMTIIALPLMIVAAYIKISVISPDFLTNIKEYLFTTGASEADLEGAFSTTGYLLTTAIYSLFGIVIGGIAAFALKTK